VQLGVMCSTLFTESPHPAQQVPPVARDGHHAGNRRRAGRPRREPQGDPAPRRRPVGRPRREHQGDTPPRPRRPVGRPRLARQGDRQPAPRRPRGRPRLVRGGPGRDARGRGAVQGIEPLGKVKIVVRRIIPPDYCGQHNNPIPISQVHPTKTTPMSWRLLGQTSGRKTVSLILWCDYAVRRTTCCDQRTLSPSGPNLPNHSWDFFELSLSRQPIRPTVMFDHV
jgi:hypothetical protein